MGDIEVWNIKRSKVTQMPAQGPAIFALRFWPNQNTIATAGDSDDVNFWNANTGRKLPQQLAGTGGTIRSLSFDPSGKRLVTGSDGGILLWDLATDKLIGSPLPGGTTGGSGTFFPNGKEVVAVFQDGTGVLWNVDPNRWSTQACRIANRNFTHAEWSAYLPDRPYSKTCP